jgi:hypothetical protein
MRTAAPMQRERGRRLVALLGHAPALWLIYREPLPKHLRLINVLAAVATVGVMAAVYRVAAPPWKFRGALVSWLAGHLAWGLYLGHRP